MIGGVRDPLTDHARFGKTLTIECLSIENMPVDREELRGYMSHFNEFDKEALTELRNKLREFNNPTRLKQLFDTICSNKDWMEDIIERSYSHKIGFDKLVLISMEDPERKLRLHIWNGKTIPQQATDADIHNHRWNFCSTILTGIMEFEIFERQSGREVYEYEYTPVGKDSKYSLDNLGKSELNQKFSGSFQAGMDYEIAHDVIHRTYVRNDELTATLMFQGPQCKPKTNVFNEQKIENSENITVDPVSQKYICKQFENILDKLNS